MPQYWKIKYDSVNENIKEKLKRASNSQRTDRKKTTFSVEKWEEKSVRKKGNSWKNNNRNIAKEWKNIIKNSWNIEISNEKSKNVREKWTEREKRV